MAFPPSRRLVLAAVAGALVLSGCSASLGMSSGGNGAGTGGSGGSASAGSSTAAAKPALQVASPAAWNQPLTVNALNGTLATVTVTDTHNGDELAGAIDGQGAWQSSQWPSSGATYKVVASVTGESSNSTVSTKVTVERRPDATKMHFGILPGTGAVVGVNAPIVVRFDHKVTRQADVERALTVATSTPVVGAWHWINSSELHFRPEQAWPAHTTVSVKAAFDNLQMSSARWGTRDVSLRFTVGDAHVTVVDDKTKTFTVKVNGKTRWVWPTSLGRPQYETRTGNYIVLEKDPLREMTSCAAKITCDKTSPDYYDLKVQWATRLSWSGTFVHAAPWDAAKQGLVDSSHGCIHLTVDRAKSYFDFAQYGDIVEVLHTSRPINDLVNRGDPGVSDWNTPWPAWVAGSALDAPITTQPLSA